MINDRPLDGFRRFSYDYELCYHIIPGWYTPREATRRHHSSGVMWCGKNPHSSTAKTLRRLYFPHNTKKTTVLDVVILKGACP
jgi:hypothetical protein